jgi:hypothetical protein
MIYFYSGNAFCNFINDLARLTQKLNPQNMHYTALGYTALKVKKIWYNIKENIFLLYYE